MQESSEHWGSALNATQNDSLAPTVRIHWVLQSTSPSPVPFSFFSSFISSCSRVKISLGFLYWTGRRKKKRPFLKNSPQISSCKSFRVIMLKECKIDKKYHEKRNFCRHDKNGMTQEWQVHGGKNYKGVENLEEKTSSSPPCNLHKLL